MKYKQYLTQKQIAELLNYSNITSFHNSSKHDLLIEYTNVVISLVEKHYEDKISSLKANIIGVLESSENQIFNT